MKREVVQIQLRHTQSHRKEQVNYQNNLFSLYNKTLLIIVNYISLLKKYYYNIIVLNNIMKNANIVRLIYNITFFPWSQKENVITYK